MRYDILISNIKNPRAKPVIARQIAQSQKIPLVKALSFCETMPCLYMLDVGEEESIHQIKMLSKLGVTAARRVKMSYPHGAHPHEGVTSAQAANKVAGKSALTSPLYTTPGSQPRSTAIFRAQRPSDISNIGKESYLKPQPMQARWIGIIIVVGIVLFVTSLLTCPRFDFSGLGFGHKSGVDAEISPYVPHAISATTAQKSIDNKNEQRAAKKASVRMLMAFQSDKPEIQRELYRQAIAEDSASVNGWAGYASATSPVHDSALSATITLQTINRFGDNAILLADQIQSDGALLSLNRGTNGICAGFLQVNELPRDSLIAACVRTGLLLRDLCGCEKLALRITTPTGSGIRIWVNNTHSDSLTAESITRNAVFSAQKPDL